VVLSSDRSVGDIGRELGVEWSAIRFGPLTGPLVLRWQAQRAEPHKTAGDQGGRGGTRTPDICLVSPGRPYGDGRLRNQRPAVSTLPYNGDRRRAEAAAR